MQKKLNLKYAASQFFYFTLFASMFAFISVFLLDKGFDNTTIGLVLSLIGLGTIGIQTLFANYLDRNKEVSLRDIVSIVVLLIILASALLFFLDTGFLILLLVVLSFSLSQALIPLLNSMAFLYEEDGIRINYGFARGMGSLAYAIVTVSLGTIVERTSPEYLPVFYLVFAILLLLSIRSYKLSEKDKLAMESEGPTRKISRKTIVSEKTFPEFLKEYKKLVFLMAGVVFLFFGHVLINNFFIQVITPIGGNYQTMGIAIFIGTILELPAMFGFNRLAKRIPVHRLLKTSAVFFLGKHLLTFLAPNLIVIYFAQALQVGAFAVAYPALVEYTQSAIAKEDLVRGQSLLANAMGFSNIFAAFAGGILLDSIGVSNTLLIAVFTTAIGLGIVFLTVEDHSEESVISSY